MKKQFEFVIKWIKTVQKMSAEKGEGKDGKGYKGAHSVWSGFNTSFKQVFPGDDPVQTTKDMADEGLIVSKPFKGGAKLYLPEDQPQSAILREVLEGMAT